MFNTVKDFFWGGWGGGLSPRYLMFFETGLYDDIYVFKTIKNINLFFFFQMPQWLIENSHDVLPD